MRQHSLSRQSRCPGRLRVRGYTWKMALLKAVCILVGEEVKGNICLEQKVMYL